MTHALFTCTKCNMIFRSRHNLDNHIKCNHQSSVKVEFPNGKVAEVKRAEDTFKCKCKKSFKLPYSLRRHVKRRQGEVAEQRKNERERESVNGNDTDAPAAMVMDE